MSDDPAVVPTTIWTSLLAGLLRPSALGLGTTLIVTLALFAALSQITAGQVQRLAGWMGGDRTSQSIDVYLVTSRALGLSTSRTQEPGLVLLGGSTTRESLDERLASHLLGFGASSHRLTNLSGSGQTIIESVALADMLPPNFRGVVVLGVNPIRLGKANDPESVLHPRYGVSSPFMAEQARRLGARPDPITGRFAIDQRAFLLRMWGDLTANPGTLMRAREESPRRHWYYDKKPLPEGILRQNFQLTSRDLAGYDRVARDNMEALAGLIARLRSRNISIVLLEAPVSPRFVREGIGPAAYQHHLGTMRAFTAREGVPYLNNNADADLRAQDFFDWGHLRNPAVTDRLTRRLVAQIQPMLRAQEQSR